MWLRIPCTDAYSEQKQKYRHPCGWRYFCFYIIFTSMLTPDGRERLVNASITFALGFSMSITRLCMRISNCSRASLCTKVERFTVYFLISVGKGIGPTTAASKRNAVSIIDFTLVSRILCSYARTRIRSFWISPAAAFLVVLASAINSGYPYWVANVLTQRSWLPHRHLQSYHPRG